MASWLSDVSANRHIRTYVKDFLDVSGNMTIRNGNIDISGGTLNDISVGAGSGTNSVAIGIGPDASGVNAIAIGYLANATGIWDTAIGVSANATAGYSVSIGPNATASGTQSVCLGYVATSSGACSVAIGRSANASGGNAIAIGRAANVTSNYSMALGQSAKARNGSVALAIGYNTNADGESSVALGRDANAETLDSTAIGKNAKAHTGSYATALGSTSNAYATQSVSVGFSTKAGGYRSVAIGAYANTTTDNRIQLGTSTQHVCVDGYIRAGHNSNLASYFGRAAIGYAGHSDHATFAHIDKNNTSSYSLQHNSSGATQINAASGQSIWFRINNSNKMVLNSSGRLGLGTTNPSRGLLHVNGSVNYTLGARFYNSGGANGYLTMSRALSIYTSKQIACEEIQLFSDERIKKNIVEVPDNLSLQMVRDLPIKYYNYIDEFSKGTDKVIGFIAQEVKEIIPNAVRMGSDTIPDEYRLLEDFTWEETDDSKFNLSCDLQDCSGVNYRFEVSNDPETEGEIVDVIGNNDNTFTFDKQYSHVFVYGKEVDDFHRLDKNQIFAVGMSALQEVDRQQVADKARIATLETQLADLLARVSALESA